MRKVRKTVMVNTEIEVKSTIVIRVTNADFYLA